MNSYLYAINYKHLIHEIEKDNYISSFFEQSNACTDKSRTKSDENYTETSFTEINSEHLSSATDNTLPSLPWSLDLRPITNTTPSPTLLHQELNYDEDTSESDDQNQFQKRYFTSNITKHSNDCNQLPKYSIDFIRSYLDKLHSNPSTCRDYPNKNILVSTSTFSNESMHDLNDYLNQLNTEEIIETTIDFINSSTKSFQ